METLNNLAFNGALDVTKLSFHALGHVLDKYVLLKSGSALGRGCGPLLVTKTNNASTISPADMQIAVPGKYTTAALLLRMCFPQCRNIKIMRFDSIMPAIVNGDVDAGVIIHESRFTYKQYGLSLIQDLGAWWEDVSGCPIPLGGIAAKRSLGKEQIAKIDSVIAKSVQWAFRHPRESRPYIKKHAQELDDKVIDEHINLYVNDFSINLGEEGLSAINDFLCRGNIVKAFSCDPNEITL